MNDVRANKWRRFSRRQAKADEITTKAKRRHTAISVDDFIQDYICCNASPCLRDNVEHPGEDKPGNGSLSFGKEKQLKEEAESDAGITDGSFSADTSVTSMNSESSSDTEEAETNKPHGPHNMHTLIEELLRELLRKAGTSSPGSPPEVRSSGVAPGRPGCVVRTLSDLSTLSHQSHLFEDETIPTPILQRRISENFDRQRKFSAWWADEQALLLNLDWKSPYERIEL